MNQIEVDKEKVPVLKDNIKEGVVTRVMVGEHSRVGSSQTTDQQWRDQTTDITVESFTKGVGPNVPISARIRGILFQLFFITTLIDMIDGQTNLYASQVMEPSRYKWTKLTADELWAYFVFMILMGINQLPALADYWKLDPTYRHRPIADRITCDRFPKISRYLHFVDNTTLPSRTDSTYNKLGKIQPVLDSVTQQLPRTILTVKSQLTRQWSLSRADHPWSSMCPRSPSREASKYGWELILCLGMWVRLMCTLERSLERVWVRG